MNLFFVVFRSFVLLPNSMSRLIHNRCTCKLIIKTTAAYVRAQEQLRLFFCFRPIFCSHCYYVLVSTRAMIGQFSGPYRRVRPAKILKLVLLQNCSVIYRQVFLTFIAKVKKLSFTLNFALMRAE